MVQDGHDDLASTYVYIVAFNNLCRSDLLTQNYIACEVTMLA